MTSFARIDELRQKFDENPRRYFAPLANEYRKAGDLAQAIEICRAHLAQQPGHMSGHIVLAQALYESGQAQEAREVFHSALELDPENLIALRHLGDIARDSGDVTDARAWYQRVLDVDPRNPEIVQRMEELAAGGTSPVMATPEPPTRNAEHDAATPGMATLGLADPEPTAHQPPAGESAAAPFSATDDALPLDANLFDTGNFETVSFDEVVFEEPAPFEQSAPSAPPSAELTFDSFGAGTFDIDSFGADAAETQASAGEWPSLSSETMAEAAQPDAGMSGGELELEMPDDAPPRPADGLRDAGEEFGLGSFEDAAPAAAELSSDTGFELPELDVPASGGETWDRGEIVLEEVVLESDVFAGGAASAASVDPSLDDVDLLFSDGPPEPAPPPAPPASPVVASGAPPAPEGAFVTETMAELYLRQGFRDQALQVYRQLLAASPRDERLRARVAELEVGEPAEADAAMRLSGRYRALAASSPDAPVVRDWLHTLAQGRVLAAPRVLPWEMPSSDGEPEPVREVAPADEVVPPAPPSQIPEPLDALFEVPAPTAGPATPTPPGAQTFSFEQFFREESPPPREPARAEEPSGETDAAAELADFQSWLSGLKKQ
ncbi:MAG TPA: tetratricopeptide repeat protein [Gemmatimonadaceae bacterium]|nr:tetratricopeptide repeat protein [Gemmatimonadaceae bacterium]